jgi:uncharacterized MAPEG superfamily protein
VKTGRAGRNFRGRLSIWGALVRLFCMTIPLWCLLVAVVLPYVWFSVAAPARIKQFGAAFDPHAPRAQDPELRGRASRAQGAHVNALEALTYFAPAVLVAHVTHADPEWSARLAIAFVVLRVIHGVVYLADKPPLRTLSFALGYLVSIGLFVLAARA